MEKLSGRAQPDGIATCQITKFMRSPAVSGWASCHSWPRCSTPHPGWWSQIVSEPGVALMFWKKLVVAAEINDGMESAWSLELTSFDPAANVTPAFSG